MKFGDHRLDYSKMYRFGLFIKFCLGQSVNHDSKQELIYQNIV